MPIVPPVMRTHLPRRSFTPAPSFPSDLTGWLMSMVPEYSLWSQAAEVTLSKLGAESVGGSSRHFERGCFLAEGLSDESATRLIVQSVAARFYQFFHSRAWNPTGLTKKLNQCHRSPSP